jgi:1-deoxy-D-xylulose-5-phosphate synthase
MNIVDIKDPSFLKEMNVQDLEQLSKDIREFLIASISETGGHFSSNLGVVELTIAMHKVFDSPKDKLIFDVGHQSYTHKILTGRAKDFPSLRKFEGLSGYLKRSESEHDVFEAGHSSTSLAAMAGIEFAKKYNQEDYKVVALIGDGAITAGMAYEALNFLGNYSDHQPIIILNDNEMSISKNTGYLSKMLNNIRVRSGYRKIKLNIKKIVPRFLYGLSTKVERSVKGFVSSNNIFDDLGFRYYGPIDGHDIKQLIRYLTAAKNSNRPCVVHVLTEKGKGYSHSEKDINGLWHGVSPFDIETGYKKTKSSKLSWSEIIGQYMIHYAQKEKRFGIVIPAMIAGSGLLEFQQLYPDRLHDVGIAEQMAVTMSAGLAIQNVHVFCPIYSTFLQRAYDQVNHDVARQQLKVVFGIDRAGIVGADGETHQGVFDIPLLRSLPHMTIAHPHTPTEAFELLNYAFSNQNNGPFALRYERGSFDFNKEEPITTKIATLTWNIEREGSGATIVAFGSILTELLNEPQTEELDLQIINAKIIKPLDEKMIRTIISRKKPIIIYEESQLLGGFGSSVLEFLHCNKLPSENVHLMGLPDEFIQHGTKQEILKKYNLDVMSIIKRVKEFY